MSDELTAEMKEKNKIDVDIAVGNGFARKEFLKELGKWQNDYHRNERPYDYRAAKIDFEEAQSKEFKREQPTYMKKGLFEEDIEIKNFDFKKYGQDNRFVKVKETVVMEDKLIDGMKRKVQTGIYVHYQSKSRGEKIAILIATDPDGVPLNAKKKKA